MIKTTTLKKNVNLNQSYTDLFQEKTLHIDLEAFYRHIQPELNQLKRNPSAETIQGILDYSRSK